MNGILVIDKPQNFTSFDVVAVVRKKFGTKKVGHGGTLDPMATGVLPIFIGNATKAVDLVCDKSKSYRAGFRLGLTSDTLDIWGDVSECEPKTISQSVLMSAMERFKGETEQIPPMYSALKVNGQKLCDLARKGVEVERKSRKITVSRLELLEFDGQEGIIEVDCSSGTYIRSLIDDIGKAAGTRAVMTSLVRTKSCGFGLEKCITADDLRTKSPEEIALYPVDFVLGGYKEIVLDEVQQRLYKNGARLDAERLSEKPPVETLLRICSDKGELLGVGKVSPENELISVKRFISEI